MDLRLLCQLFALRSGDKKQTLETNQARAKIGGLMLERIEWGRL